MRNNLENEDDAVTKPAQDVRQGRLGRPALYVLVIATLLGSAALLIAYLSVGATA